MCGYVRITGSAPQNCDRQCEKCPHYSKYEPKKQEKMKGERKNDDFR